MLYAMRWLALWTVLAFVSVSLQGCLPPDWSFCDCDFRDNFWNHVLNDVHMLWDGSNLQVKARDNTTFQGRYLSKMPEGYDCPMMAVEFWKGWPRFGMTRGLIEGSMGDLWMPAARDRIKGICMAGHFWLTVLCSQHFLVKAARAQENGDADSMQFLEAAYSHMVAIRNMGQPYQLRNCMGQEGWPPHAGALHAYAERWLGREAEGTSPMAAYMGGKLDHYQMLFDGKLAHTEKTRRDALPHRRPCVPFKDPKCWKRMSKLLMDTCEYCCSPFEHKSGRGWDLCFDDVWTFERCCNNDFQDLVCSMKRKGEEGGCVDCQKSVMYTCLTPPEKNLQDAQNNYNAKVDEYNRLNQQAAELKESIAKAQADLYYKDQVYREKWSTYDQDLRIWSAAYNNQSRLISESRLTQQQLSWNNSVKAHAETTASLRNAQEALRNATGALRNAEQDKHLGEEALKRNESELQTATAALANQRHLLEEAKVKQQAAEDRFVADEAETLRAAAEEAAAREQALRANRTRDEVFADTAHDLRSRTGVRAVANASHAAATTVRNQAQAITSEARSVSQAADRTAAAAAATLAEAEQNETAATRAAESAQEVERSAQRLLEKRQADLANVSAREAFVHQKVLALQPGSEALQCLISRTPANISARPGTDWRVVSSEADPETTVTCTPPPPAEDKYDFCAEWASDGQCVTNAKYMLKACQRSCHGKEGVPAPAPVCPSPGSAAQQSKIVLEREELMDLVEQLTGGDLANDEEALAAERGLTAVADEKEAAARNSVEVAHDALRQAKQRAQMAAANVTAGELAIEQAQKVVQEAVQLEQIARANRNEAEQQVLAQEYVVKFWETIESFNVTLVQQAAAVVEDRREVLKQQRLAVAQALELEQGLQKAHQIAEDGAEKAREVANRTKTRVISLSELIEQLNSTINENLTMIVSDWLQAREAEEEEKSQGWGRQLLKAARSVLVSLVSSIEAFLDTYVMSMTDKESVVELIRAVEDHKAEKRKLKEHDQAVVNAEKQAQDASASLTKAEASRRSSEVAVNQTEITLAEEKAAHQAAQEVLDEARASLHAERENLNATKRVLAQRDEDVQNAIAAHGKAVEGVHHEQARLKRLQAAEQEARSSVVEAGYGLSSAEARLSSAIAEVVDAYFTQLRQQCDAGEAEFQVYLRERPLLSLLRSAVLGRQQAVSAAGGYLEESTANRSAAEVARDLAHDATLAAKEVLREREATQQSTAEELRLQEAVLSDREAQLGAARVVLEKAQDELAHVLGIREQADAEARTETGKHAAASAVLSEAVSRRAARSVELDAAVNTTARRTNEVALAEVREVNGEQAVQAAKIWLKEFIESLEIPAKEQAESHAKSVQTQWEKNEDRAARYERWQKGALKTHEGHFKLLNTQVELNEKDEAKEKAKAEHSDAEKAVVTAQEHLDSLFKSEESTAKSIADTYQNLQTLLEQHRVAQEEWNKQDPKERERSFSTTLSGAGADPNGIDIR